MERVKKNQRVCVSCNKSFTKQGNKVTCSAPCKDAYKELRAAKVAASKPAKPPAACLDLSSKDYIIDRIVVDELTGCWVWQKSVNPQTGYGQIGYPPYTAHKLSFILWKGTPVSQVVRHQCHNKVCCNPNHLVDGTHGDNYHDSYDVHMAADAKRRGRISTNAIPVTVNGVYYPSKLHAMQSLSVSWNTLHEMI